MTKEEIELDGITNEEMEELSDFLASLYDDEECEDDDDYIEYD